MAKNINWINAVRAICMFLIYFVHGQTYYDLWLGDVNNFIHPVYVNAFFFVSGYLIFRKQLSIPVIDEDRNLYLSKIGSGRKLIANVFFRMWIPCLIFSFIEFIPKKIIKGGDITLITFLRETIGGGTYWFVSALMVCEVILFILLITRQKNVWFYFIILCIITAFGMSDIFDHSYPRRYDFYCYYRAFLACCFLGAGGLYWKYEKYFDKLKFWLLLIGIIVYTIVFTYFADDALVLISLNKITLLGILASVIGCVVLVIICKFLPKIKILTFVGTNTLLFYFVSGAIPLTVNLFFKRLIPGTTMIGLTIYIATIFGLAILITYLIQRFLYPLLDLRLLKKEK